MKREKEAISWATFCTLVKGTTLEKEERDWKEPGSTLLTFANSMKIQILSGFEGDWSEVTPGEGVMPAEVYLLEPGK